VFLFSRKTKETMAYILGAVGFTHELLIAQVERPFLLTASLALMGFPLVLKNDQKNKENGNGSSQE
jgi:hypothetical protein